jgi:DNA repair protein RecN (Recombination protein N)
MLSRLSIRDIVLIEKLDVDFSGGLTVLTGETGAGKSILLDAVALALGARGDGALVRSGCQQGQVIAVFDVEQAHPAVQLLELNAIGWEGQLILRRLQGADGRSKAFINDQPVSVSLLRDVGQTLVEIHGQHDDRALLDRQSHQHLLDAFGGCDDLARRTEQAWHAWKDQARALEELRESIHANAREVDYLRSSVQELTMLSPEPDEETALAEARSRMMRVEKVASDLAEAHEQLAGEGSPIPEISSLLRRLEKKGSEITDLLSGAMDALESAISQLSIAQEELENAVRAAEFDPAELESTEERLFALRAAARKYNVPVDQLTDLAVRLADRLETLDIGDAELAELGKKVSRLEADFFREAGELSSARTEAARELGQRVAAELPALKLEQATFEVRMQSGHDFARPGGIDQIEFQVQTNPGTPFGPLTRIASGGELSRFLLALKVALSERGSAPTLIFDEIDSGAGGAVADAIGRRLASLATKVQVLCVTHAPQVAARAADHLLITKSPAGPERAETAIRRIADIQRREEIARMLAGATITDEARAAAEQLINQPAA